MGMSKQCPRKLLIWHLMEGNPSKVIFFILQNNKYIQWMERGHCISKRYHRNSKYRALYPEIAQNGVTNSDLEQWQNDNSLQIVNLSSHILSNKIKYMYIFARDWSSHFYMFNFLINYVSSTDLQVFQAPLDLLQENEWSSGPNMVTDFFWILLLLWKILELWQLCFGKNCNL